MNTSRPLALLAELTYRCPLRCPYCANPVMYPIGSELRTSDWASALKQAAEIGVVQIGFSGGEPLLRSDLEELISVGRDARLYTNLITSGIGLTPARAQDLKRAGLDNLQLSFQSDEALLADKIAGVHSHEQKLAAAAAVNSADLPLSLNVVLHRRNLHRIEQIIALAETLGVHRLELAHTQYYGWAFKNLKALIPTEQQLERASKIVAAAKHRLSGKLNVVYVQPDYFGTRPKACMNGWGNTHITIDPVGRVLPCPNASEIKGMMFENIRSVPLAQIWNLSSAFEKFRGTEWMQEPCRGCEFREQDYGGCRCQAALLTGDATATDPACSLSPHRKLLELARSEPYTDEFVYRANPVGSSIYRSV